MLRHAGWLLLVPPLAMLIAVLIGTNVTVSGWTLHTRWSRPRFIARSVPAVSWHPTLDYPNELLPLLNPRDTWAGATTLDNRFVRDGWALTIRLQDFHFEAKLLQPARGDRQHPR